MDIDQTYCNKSLRDRRILSVEKYIKSNAGKYSRIYNIDVEDMMQDAWVYVLEAEARGKSDGVLVLAVKQGCIKTIRKKTSPTEHMNYSATSVNEHGDDIDIESEYSEGDFMFRSYLNQISKDYPVDLWRAFYLIEIESYTIEEAARECGSTVDKVRRCRDKIRSRIRSKVIDGVDTGGPIIEVKIDRVEKPKKHGSVINLVNDDGRKYSGDRATFMNEYGIEAPRLSKVLTGKQKQIKGWRLIK